MASHTDTPIDLDRLRAAAKRLKKAFAAGDRDAVSRLAAVVPNATAPKHSDFLHVVAREHGHESWPKLKLAAETAAMTRMQRARRLEHALRYGQRWVIERLLNGEPDLATGDLALEVATYDLAAVTARLARDRAAAVSIIGDRSPLLHLAFSKYIHTAPEKRDAMLQIAALLVANGADVNDGCPVEAGSAQKLSALYGALAHADNMTLAAWLLDHGANPDDGESLYHATELSHHDGLRLLLKHGATVRGTNALPHALDFNDAVAVRMLLEHDAAQRQARADQGDKRHDSVRGLHQAARRLCSPEIAGLLLDFGADPAVTWNGHSPFATASIFGNRPFADVLASRGGATELSPTERLLAACASGETPAGRIDPEALSREDRLLVNRLIWLPGRLDHVRALIAAGLEFDRPDETQMTPLHYACWEGLPDAAALLLSLGADITRRNGYGGDAIESTMHGAEFCPKPGRDHIGCARLLLEAGAKVDAKSLDRCGNQDLAGFIEDWSAAGNS